MTESVLDLVALFPALGRFGSLPMDCLDVSIDACIREIRLVIPPEHGRTFLNLRRLEFYSASSREPVMPDGVCQQSSIYNDDAKHGPGSLFEYNGIHSKSEVSPWWSMTFREPQALKSVRVLNTRNMWGVRSWPLQVRIVDIDGNERCVYAGRAGDSALASLKALSEWAPSLKIEIGGLFRPERIRADLIAGVLGLLEDATRPETTPWRLLMELVDSRPGAKWEDGERDLAAAFLLAQYETSRKTSVNSLGGGLSTRGDILRFQASINQRAYRLGLGEFVISRHGLQRARLRSHSVAYLDQLRAVFDALSSWGYEACLGYGTLLGAVREGNFIAHDDDVDVIYRMTDGAGWNIAVREQEKLANRFREMGYLVVAQAPSSLNMHIIDAETRGMVDLFPSWDDGGMSHLHMQKMKIESVASDILWPTSTLAFLGEDFPVPKRPEEFLEARYGPQWQSPDQFFEWPWRLQELPEEIP